MALLKCVVVKNQNLWKEQEAEEPLCMISNIPLLGPQLT